MTDDTNTTTDEITVADLRRPDGRIDAKMVATRGFNPANALEPAACAEIRERVLEESTREIAADMDLNTSTVSDHASGRCSHDADAVGVDPRTYVPADLHAWVREGER